MSKNSWVVLSIIGVVVVGGLLLRGSSNTAPTANVSDVMANEVITNVQFLSHIQAQLPEQDVFVEKEASRTQVIRVEGNAAQTAAMLAKPVFATAAATAHDPFKLGTTPLGPFNKGKGLGFTLQQWLAATGNGTYTVNGNEAQMNFAFSKLVPNGVYTVWCSRITFPPNFGVVDKPCGAEDGSQNSFTADPSGNATFSLTTSLLTQSSPEAASVIALAYHSDGLAHGSVPGDFGSKTHVQIFFILPVPENTAAPVDQ